ncbi:MAG: tRNA lysidine(34) synthetase TilS [Chloroflexi bacterium]|nr:tRNA lysidine(34) synthetase TilS [Chloroflexota bacterium]
MPSINRLRGSDFVRSVRSVLESGGYLGRSARLVIGVSGGPDSTALLAALVELQDDCQLELHVVHVDHGLRAESRGDAAYVRRLCARWNVPVTVRRVDVPEMRRAGGLSVEEAARRARHLALLEAADAFGAGAVVLGHTTDDQIETVLLSLLRGAGLRGLAGMVEESESPFTMPNGKRVPILRPLLGVTRAGVMDYLKERRLRPRQDASNADPAHLRNRVRHEILPLMERIREGASGAVGRASVDARVALEYIETEADGLWGAACEVAADRESVRIDRSAMRGAHAALRHVVFERAIATLLGSAEGFTRRNYLAMESLIVEGQTGSEISLPNGLFLSCTNDGHAVLSISSPSVPLPELVPAEMLLDGSTMAGGWTFTSRVVVGGIELCASGERASLLPGELRVVIGHADGQRRLCARARRPGDRIRMAGGTRKVQDVFVDKKIPRMWRDRVPIVVDGDTGEIVWIVGVAGAAMVTVVGENSTVKGTIEA